MAKSTKTKAKSEKSSTVKIKLRKHSELDCKGKTF